MNSLGFSIGHDSSYSIFKNGKPLIHSELERHTRIKYNMDEQSIIKFLEDNYSLEIETNDIVTGAYGWLALKPDSINEKDFLKKIKKNKYWEVGHHLSHASGAYYSCNFNKSLIITIDGVGCEKNLYDFEYDKSNYEQKLLEKKYIITNSGEHTNHLNQIFISCCIWEGIENKIYPIKQLSYKNNKNDIFGYSEMATPGRIGHLWEKSVSEIFDLKKFSEGTVMAMASYGDKNKYYKIFYDFLHGKNPYKKKKNVKNIFTELKNIIKNSKNIEKEMFDVAAGLQYSTELTIKEILDPYIFKYDTICFSGGVSLNCVMLGKIKEWYPHIKNIHCDPVPHDGGHSMGSQFFVWHHLLNNPKTNWEGGYLSPYLGKKYSLDEVNKSLNDIDKDLIKNNVNIQEIIKLLEEQKIIAIYGGGAESGRRALGNRSIIADPRNKDMKKHVNDNVKHRQWYRPISPSILREDVSKWFEYDIDSPYMSFGVKFKSEVKDKVPAVVHVDGTGRLQTVNKELNPFFYQLLQEWKKHTGIPILINTSFNDSEPIVENPVDAIKCYLKTEIDYLYFYDYNILVSKKII